MHTSVEQSAPSPRLPRPSSVVRVGGSPAEGVGDSTLMQLVLALAQVQHDRQGRMPARLPTTELALRER